MFAPHPSTAAVARYALTVAPWTSDEGFDHGHVQAAITALVRELGAGGEDPETIIALAVDRLPLGPAQQHTIWGMSLRDWVRTTAREALALPAPD